MVTLSNGYDLDYIWCQVDRGQGQGGYGLACGHPDVGADQLRPSGYPHRPYRSVITWYCWRAVELTAGAGASVLPVAANPTLGPLPYILRLAQDILVSVKHLVDVDETLLDQARATLGTSTIKDTVNEALRLAASRKRAELDAAMDELAELVRALPVEDRANAW